MRPFFFNAWAARDAEDAFARGAGAADAGPGAGRAAEQAAAGHVVRLASAMAGHADPFEYQDDVFYWKSRRGREVDFVVRTGAGGTGTAARSRSNGRAACARTTCREYSTLEGRRGPTMGGIILSRDDAREQAGLVVVPAALFMLLV